MKNITMYTGPFCNFCEAAKRLLVRNNLNYKEIDISAKDSLRDEIVTENFFSKGIPLCGVLGGGYNKDFNKLIELHASLHRSCAKLL